MSAGEFKGVIEFFGGREANPNAYPSTDAGFDAYLRESNVLYFSGREMTAPYHPAVATALGKSVLLPPNAWWPRGAALAKLADRLRELVGSPVFMRNWWRPTAYNKAVDGAARSEHITAHGVDLDFPSASHRRIAEEVVMGQWYSAGLWNISVGMGLVTLHIGLYSPRGRRHWYYKSYGPSRPW